jgi:hypothetical protein
MIVFVDVADAAAAPDDAGAAPSQDEDRVES